MLLRQSTVRNLSVFMTDSADHVTGKTGLTLTITASKDGAAFASISPTVTELATGWYSLALTTTHTNTLGDFALHITGASADPTDALHQVVAELPIPSLAGIRQNTALAGFQFTMLDSNGNAALSLTGIAAQVSIDGAAFANCVNVATIAEIGNGWYKISLAAADTNGKVLAFKFTASGAKATQFTTVTDT